MPKPMRIPSRLSPRVTEEHRETSQLEEPGNPDET